MQDAGFFFFSVLFGRDKQEENISLLFSHLTGRDALYCWDSFGKNEKCID